MAERINRRDLIIEVTTRLFMKNGYQATSIREIADEVGCTEAALYYHFKGGKRAIFKAIFETKAPRILDNLAVIDQATSVEELILLIGQAMATMQDGDKIQWLAREFNNLTPDERQMLIETLMTFHDRAKAVLERFFGPEEKTEILAWLIMCTGMGYQQLFRRFGMREVTSLTAEDMSKAVVEMLRQKAGTGSAACNE